MLRYDSFFNNFLLLGATDRAKIRSVHHRIFFDVSYTPFHFSRTLPSPTHKQLKLDFIHNNILLILIVDLLRAILCWGQQCLCKICNDILSSAIIILECFNCSEDDVSFSFEKPWFYIRIVLFYCIFYKHVLSLNLAFKNI